MQPDASPIDAAELLNRKISFYARKEATTAVETTVGDLLKDLPGVRWQGPVEGIRSLIVTGSTNEADDIKRRLPAVTFSGLFGRHTKEELIKHSGLLCLDFDDLGDGVQEAKRKLRDDPHVLAIFLSPSGQGLKVIVPITGGTSEEHTQCFKVAEAYFQGLGLTVDPACKDVSRLCFVSYDPALVLNNRPVLPVSHTHLSFSSAPSISNLQSPIYTTPSAEDRVAFARALTEKEEYLEQLRLDYNARHLSDLYPMILEDKATIGFHRRNEWLCEVVPFLFRACAQNIARDLVEVHRNAWRSLYSGQQGEHLGSFERLWTGCESAYPETLSLEERSIYEALSEPYRSAFRICRDLAMRDNGEFFMGSDHLALRLKPHRSVNGWRILSRLQQLGLIEIVKKGCRIKAPGDKRPATRYRWCYRLPSEGQKTPKAA